MTVYRAFKWCYDENHTIGIFDAEELALCAIAEDRPKDRQQLSQYNFDYYTYEIETFTLNEADPNAGRFA